MDRAVTQWARKYNIHHHYEIALLNSLCKSYTIYGNMLLLPGHTLDNTTWKQIEECNNIKINDILPDLWKAMCQHLKVTHIALNKPIPLHQDAGQGDMNVLRSPTSFTPLYGDFGPETSTFPPTQQDFDQAFWVTAKQNGIYQTWAPRWTMFSRGNVSEKARLLTLPSVLQAVEEGACSAVDLYAGIGYFAFSYVQAGVRSVMCWDISAWSCEGLRRGARRNKWEVVTFEEGTTEEEAMMGSDARLLVFNESNACAPVRVARMRDQLPPIRHVNCGMLPSSRESLEIAAKVLDARFLGWVHVHENFLVEEIEAKAEDTREEFVEILSKVRQHNVHAEIEYINRLKNYAPGVMHCVIDIVVHTSSPTCPLFPIFCTFPHLVSLLFTSSTRPVSPPPKPTTTTSQPTDCPYTDPPNSRTPPTPGS